MPSVGNNSVGAGQYRCGGVQMLWICSARHTFLLSSYLMSFLDKDEDLKVFAQLVPELTDQTAKFYELVYNLARN